MRLLPFALAFTMPMIPFKSKVAARFVDKENNRGFASAQSAAAFESVSLLDFFGVPPAIARDEARFLRNPLPVDIHMHMDMVTKDYYDIYCVAYMPRFFLSTYLGDNSVLNLAKPFEESNDGNYVLRKLSDIRFNKSFPIVDRVSYEPEWSPKTTANSSVSIIFQGPEFNEAYGGIAAIIFKDAKGITSEEEYRDRVRNFQFKLIARPTEDKIFNCVRGWCPNDPNYCPVDIRLVLGPSSSQELGNFAREFVMRAIRGQKAGTLNIDSTVSIERIDSNGKSQVVHSRDSGQDLQSVIRSLAGPAGGGGGGYGAGDPPGTGERVYDNSFNVFVLEDPSGSSGGGGGGYGSSGGLWVAVSNIPSIGVGLSPAQIIADPKISAGRVQNPSPQRALDALDGICVF